MKHKEENGQMTADIIILYSMLLLLTFICRIWPVILLAIMGLFIVMIRMIFISLKSNDSSSCDEINNNIIKHHDRTFSKGELELAIFKDIEDQVTEFVLSHWKDAQWQWECSDARKRIFVGNDIFIRLNHAGGYKRAKVIYQGLKVYGLEYIFAKQENDVFIENHDNEKPTIMNYSMIAFEWCEAHLSWINEQCEKAYEKDLKELLIPIEELPVPESFEDICKEIVRRLDKETKIMTDGILIIL